MYTVITPFLVPANLPKKVNIGDGFIMDSSIKLIQKNLNLKFPIINKLPDNILEIYNFDNFKFKQNEYKLNMDKFINKVREMI